MTTITFLFGMGALGWLWYDGLKRHDGLLQLPFLTGFVVAVYPFIEAVLLFQHPERVPEDSLWRIFLMLGLACAATAAGYSRPMIASHRPPAVLNGTRLFLGGCFLQAVAWFGFWKIVSMFGGIREFYSVEGGYSVIWEGEIVKWNFLRAMNYPAIVLFFAAYRARPRAWVAWVGGICYGLLLAEVVYRGRRSLIMVMVLILALHLFYWRRISVPRWMLVPAVVLSLFGLFAMPMLRDRFQIGYDRSQPFEFNLTQAIERAIGEEGAGTVKNGTYLIAAATETGEYGCGAYYVDCLIRNLVPRQLVGEQRQQRLFLSRWKDGLDDLTDHAVGYRRPSNEYYGPFGELYSQFWFFGAVYFFLVAWVFRRLWEAGLRSQVNRAQIFLSVLLSPALLSLADSPSQILTSAVLMAGILLPITYWASSYGAAPLKRSGAATSPPDATLTTSDAS
jgi:hypothetical protein